MMGVTFCDLLAIVGLGPRAGVDRAAGKFVEALAKELRAAPAPMHALGFTAASGYWSDAGVLLQIERTSVAGAIRTKGAQKPRSQSSASSRPALKEGRIGMAREELGQLLIVFGNIAQKTAQLASEHLHFDH